MNSLINLVFILYFTLGLLQCKPNRDNKVLHGTEVKCYKDFDFRIMRPVSPMYESITYPLVRVEQTDTTLHIQFEYDKDCKRRLNLLVVSDSLWVSLDSVKEEYTHYFKVFYKPRKSYSVEYTKAADKLEIQALIVGDPTVKKNYTYTMWGNINAKKILKEPWNIDLGKAARVEENEWTIMQKGEVVKTHGKIVVDREIESQIGNYSEGCWEINGHPFNFFNYFAWKYKKIECP